MYFYTNNYENLPMEDYLYIIIGIVWVVYSIYSSRQKILKKQSQGAPPGKPSQSSPLPIPGGGGKTLLEDILREFTGEPAPATVINQPENSARVPNQELLQTNNPGKSSSVQSNLPETTPDYLQKEPSTSVKTHTIQKQVTKNESFARKFNLREAVIFSELLNRKYF